MRARVCARVCAHGVRACVRAHVRALRVCARVGAHRTRVWVCVCVRMCVCVGVCVRACVRTREPFVCRDVPRRASVEAPAQHTHIGNHSHANREELKCDLGGSRTHDPRVRAGGLNHWRTSPGHRLEPRGLHVILPLAHIAHAINVSHTQRTATKKTPLGVTHTYSIVCGGWRRPAPPTPCVRGGVGGRECLATPVCDAQQGQNGWGKARQVPETPPLGGKLGVKDDERGEDDATIVFSVKNHA